MEDTELLASPRKKPKLEEPSYAATLADTTTEVPSLPEIVPHDHPASTENLLSKPATMNSTYTSSCSQTPTAIASVPITPITGPDYEMDDARYHLEASKVFYKKLAENASNAESKTADVPDALGDIGGKEAACGITEFVSPELLGFSGILKKRYTDFLVNEILPSGEVVHLDSLQAPPKPRKNTELFGNDGNPSPADSTEPKAEASQRTNQNVKDYEQPCASTDASQAIPHADTSNEERTTLKPEVDPSAVKASHAIPHSMQGFDQHEPAPSSVDDPKKISPHKRIPPPGPSIPLSMQDLDGKQSQPEHEKTTQPEPEKITRRKEKVHIRQTSQGWVIFDKEKEDQIKKRKAEEEEAAGVQPKDATQMENTMPEGSEAVSESKELDEEQKPKQSTQASWQAFASSAPSNGFQLQNEDKDTLLSYFSPSIVDEILALYNRIVDSPHRKTKDYGMVKSGVIDRQKRITIHQDIRRIFDSRLETMTDSNGAMMIAAMAEKPTFYARTPLDSNTRNNDHGNHGGKGKGNDRSNGRGHDGRSKAQASGGAKGKPSWEDLGGKYLHFSLYKENKDTMESISWLTKQLKMNPKSFTFAGTKDRRAVTVQRVSVERVLVNAMIVAGRTLRNAYIGNFEYRPHQLQLGELTGNEFVITLRDCDFHYPVPLESKYVLEGAQMIVADAVKNLSEKGFLNYYGLQRFGTFSVGTEAVGLKMLQGDFEGAVDAILDYSPASLAAALDPSSGNAEKVPIDDRARAHALHLYRTTNKSRQAIEQLPRKYSAEASIMRHLSGKSDHRHDYLGALQTIPRNLRLMYVHAYQSLVWNVVASQRWKRFGSSVVKGDLVLISEHQDKVEGVAQAEDIDADGEIVVLPSIDDRAANPDDLFERARALTKDEAESEKYSIFDIVLPTPGYDILYPSNEIGKFYEEFMASERGGGLNPHDMRRKQNDISLSGSYRKLLARPGRDISFEIKAYKDENEQFVETDMDRLRSGSGPQELAHPRRDQGNHARHDNLAGSSNVSKQENEHTQEHDEAKHDDANHSARPKGNDSEPQPRTKTPSQESEDTEQGGVALIGGAYRDYKIAVILKLQLGASQYATMALRELLKNGGLKTYKADFSGGR